MIAHLSRAESTVRSRAIVIEARRLRSMLGRWRTIPPGEDAKKELFASVMKLVEKAGIRKPSLGESPAVKSSTPAPPAPPAPERRTVLSEGVTLVRPVQMEWRPFPLVAGVTVKLLHRDATSGAYRALVRMAPGATLPRHRHAGPEEFLVVEGSAAVGSVEARAGEYCHAEPGSVHEPISSAGGCTFFLVGSERDEVLD
jgi:quercetin dioxygenase-like cupin family protein